MSYIAITTYHASMALDHNNATMALATGDTMEDLASAVIDAPEFADGGDGCVLVNDGEHFRWMTDNEHEAWHDALMMAS